MSRLLLLLCILLLAGCGAPPAAPTAPPTVAGADLAGPWTAEQVLAAFKLAGLEAENLREITGADPVWELADASSRTLRFDIPSLGADQGSHIVTGVPAYLDTVRASYARHRQPGGASVVSHVFMRQNVLVQLDSALPADKARQYEAALQAMTAAGELGNTGWLVKAFGRLPLATRLTAAQPLLLDFTADGRYVAYDGCTTFSGQVTPWSVHHQGLQLRPDRPTIIACSPADPAVAALARRYHAALGLVASYQLQPAGHLHLAGQDGEVLLTLVAS